MSVPAIAIADLCGAVPPASTPSASESATYASVGDDERPRDERVAAVAYRKAIALDPNNAHAREALAALCRSSGDDRALLAGIASFRAGDLDGAEAVLAPMARAQGATAAGAHFVLGLIALARHDGIAGDELAAAARDPAYAELAASLSRIASRQGMFEAVLLLAPELDTNPQLLPDTPPAGAITGARQADVDLLLGGTATARPTHWLLVRDALTFRGQRTLTALDYLGEAAQVEVAIPLGADRIAARYDLDYDRIGGHGFLFANRGTVTYRHELGGLALVADYALRHRDYLAATESAFSGWVHAGEAGASFHLGPSIELDARATLWRESTVDPTFTDLAGGAVVAVHARPRDDVRLSGTLTGWYAHYDGAQPDGTVRDDLHAAFAADLEVDLADHVIAVAGASIEGNHSTVEDFRYWKLVARLGLAIAIGGP